MTRHYAAINPNIISWARERANLSVPELAKKVGTSEAHLERWEKGERAPTVKQVHTLANKTYVPMGYFYLEEPPQEQLELPDLRTLNNGQPTRPSPELLELVGLMHERVHWYADYLREQGIKRNPCVGRRSEQDPVEQIVSDIRQTLNIPEDVQRGHQEKYMAMLVQRIEDAGVLVMKQPNMGSRRRLSVSEFRGFAISDPVAPLIFVNSADVLCARLFTLIHELAHIWLGESGISDVSPHTERSVEIKCNAIAAQFLVPANEFMRSWQDDADWKQNILQIRNQFQTSRWVIARRALTLGKITLSQYRHYTSQLLEEYRRREREKANSREGGPTYYTTKQSQISKRFSNAILTEALQGKLLLRDAGNLLDMRPPIVMNYAQKLGIQT
jgi:Zn-dependent peptidase ImmA (M78 family)/DNA-binding XRE family transcriptional regulator